MVRYVAAVDIGASSGRVILGTFDSAARKLSLDEIHRFDNGLCRQDGFDCWDVDLLLQETIEGLSRIEARGLALDSVGIDTWAVDYVLLDQEGKRVGLPVAYRDHRTDGVMDQVFNKVARDEIYRRTGIQFLQFNTIYQLQALINENPAWLDRVDALLMVPDYLHYRLSGRRACEYTNASTTQLLNIETGQWDTELLERIGVPEHWFSAPMQPGRVLGEWESPSGRKIKVIPPATHDTASAVAAAPLADRQTAYISSGTWSLMGIESPVPIHGPDALALNFTNEGGVEKTYRVLKNIMGLWLIQRIREELGDCTFPELVDAARECRAGNYLINPNDDGFLNPPSMIAAIETFCERTGQGRPATPGELARCIFESLALLYRQTKQALESISGIRINLIQIVGGGANNQFLNQLTADFCQVPVATGPVEASALGNICYQLKGLGLLEDLNDIRQLIREEYVTGRCEPSRDAASIAASQALWERFQSVCQKPTPSTCSPGELE